MWDKIKDYWRNEFLQSEIYLDDYEEIIAFKQTEESIILIGYLQFNGRLSPSIYHFNDFINFIRKIGNENYNSFKIFILCNTQLSGIKKASDILALPKDIEYYYVKYNHSLGTISFNLENLTESAKSSYRKEQINLPWHHRKNIEIIKDSRFDDWSKWSTKGYEREWYESYEEEKFDSFFWQFSVSGIECYIDDSRILGFYIVWKW